MLKFLPLLLCLISTARVTMAQGESCDQPRKETKCQAKSCIPRIKGTTISWHQVTPKSFVASWRPEPRAKCYYVELMVAYTVKIHRTIPCFKGVLYQFEDLQPSLVYGVQISAVDSDCKRGRPGIPARTRTLWAPTTAPTTTPVLTRTPEPGKCGRRFFTCHSNHSECVRSKKWCNRRLNCEDGSDERGCPGGCEEIDMDFKNGNYSCTRWGSPGSVCLFDCKPPYKRQGPRYTQCGYRTRKWNNIIPTCRLKATPMFKVNTEVATDSSVTLVWEPVEGAARYTFLAIEVTRPGQAEEALMRTKSVDANECCKVILTDLKPDTEFQITMRAVDPEDVDGLKSVPIFARTVKKEAPHKEKKEESIDEEEVNEKEQGGKEEEEENNEEEAM